MSSQLDIRNIHNLEKLWSYVKEHRHEGHMDEILDAFPFLQIRNVNKENVGYIIKLITTFLDYEKFLENALHIENCLEFVLDYLKCSDNSSDDSILEFLVFLTQLLSRFRYIRANISINSERICVIIHELLKNGNAPSQCVQVLTELFSCPQRDFVETDVSDSLISEIYGNCLKFELLDLYKLGSVVIRAGNLITNTNLLYYWIEQVCSRVLPMVADELLTWEFLKCLALVYSVKHPSDFRLTQAYIKKISTFQNYLKVQDLKENTIFILRHMIYDLSSQKILPCVEDFCNEVLDPKGEIITNKDFIIVMTYLKAITIGNVQDDNETFKIIARTFHSSYSFYLPTLKAICYLYPKYAKSNVKGDAVGNMILNAMASTPHLEEVLSYNVEQLKWIFNCDKIALKYIVLRYWLKNYHNDEPLLATILETENSSLLVKTILTDFGTYNIAKRAANLIQSANNPKLSKFLTKNIPAAIKSPVSLALILEARPSIPQNPKEAIFFCRVMANLLPEMITTEAFIGIHRYSYELLFHMRKSSEAVKHFCDNYRTVYALKKACLHKNEEIAEAGMNMLIMLLKLQNSLNIKTIISIEVDFRRVLNGSNNRILRGLRLLRTLLIPNLQEQIIKLPSDDIFAQYLFVHEMEVDEVTREIFKTMISFLKKYDYLAYSCLTPIFIKMQCWIIEDEEQSKLLMDLLEILLKNIKEKVFIRGYSDKHIKKFVAVHRPSLLSLL